MFCRKSLNWGSFDVFLMIQLGLWVLGRKTTGVKVPFHQLESRVHTGFLLFVYSFIFIVVQYPYMQQTPF